jgi:hypothetical protein
MKKRGKGKLTSLGRAKVLSRRRGTRACAAGLLNAEGASFNFLTLEAILGSICLVGRDHLDKAKTPRLLGMGILHDLAFLDFAILLEKTGHLSLVKTRVNSSDEEIGSRVDGAIFVLAMSTFGSTMSEGHC